MLHFTYFNKLFPSPVINNSIIWGNIAATADNNVNNFSTTPVYNHSLVEGRSSGGK